MLWETFELMARELECSVDYLVNEAMKQYARQRGQTGRPPVTAARSAESGGGASAGGAGGPADVPSPPAPVPPSPARAATLRNTGALPPPPPRGGGLPAPPPRTSAGGAGGQPVRPVTSPLGSPARPPSPPQAPRLGAPPQAPAGGRMVMPPAVMPPNPATSGYNNGANLGVPAPTNAPLSIIYHGDKFGVNKDRFVIGRGKQSSDLTLKDPNVSRQHAMIEYQNGVYFIVDMGSTNGVEYNGQRIARKQIAEGDVFRICDHDLRFTYR